MQRGAQWSELAWGLCHTYAQTFGKMNIHYNSAQKLRPQLPQAGMAGFRTLCFANFGDYTNHKFKVLNSS